MRIVAWKCEHTGKLFESQPAFQLHQKKIRTEIAAKAEKQARIDAIEGLLQNLRLSAGGFEDIEDWIMANQLSLIDRYYENDPIRKPYKNRKPFRILEVKFLRIGWHSRVSNSHCAPLGGLQNWCGLNVNQPTGYPGWQGRIRFNTEGDFGGFFNDICRSTGINTGTGGGGGGSYEYDVKLFEDDWQGLKEQQIMEQLGSDDFFQDYA